MNCEEATKLMVWLFGWRTGSKYQPNAAVWADARARRCCKDKGRKAGIAENYRSSRSDPKDIGNKIQRNQ